MSQGIQFRHNIDLGLNQIINNVLENLSTDPVSGLIEGRVWYNTTEDRIKFYDGVAVRACARIEDLNSFGSLVGPLDASGGLPTVGSGQGTQAGVIQAGDYWRISVAGTIAGIQGGSTNLEVGDVLIALTDGASVASDFLAIQTNIDLTGVLRGTTFTIDLGDAEGNVNINTLINTSNIILQAFDGTTPVQIGWNIVDANNIIVCAKGATITYKIVLNYFI